ncbi:MAG TPA: hypothetical protein VJL31_02050 [Gemmatimonadales bacterium]|nr:hypothetical protein [Gemmatimonadales bacterium]
MKNLTVSLDEQVAKWARVRAAELDTSVSRFLGELLRDAMRQERAYDTARRAYLSAQAQPLGRPGRRYPRREELHDRAGLR